MFPGSVHVHKLLRDFSDHCWSTDANEAEGFRPACEMLQIPAGGWIYVWMCVCISTQAKPTGGFGNQNLK